MRKIKDWLWYWPDTFAFAIYPRLGYLVFGHYQVIWRRPKKIHFTDDGCKITEQELNEARKTQS